MESASLFKSVLTTLPELTAAFERYLSQAQIEETPEGILISVPTQFHAAGLQPHVHLIEKALGRPVLSVQVRRVRPQDTIAAQAQARVRPLPQPTPVASPAQQVQVPLPLTSKRVDPAAALEAEKQRRQIPPELISSPAFAEPIELVRRWAHGINHGMRGQCLWVHGESGSGKTWLVRQLHGWVKLEKRIVSVDVMSFLHEWRRSIETKQQLDFIRKYRKEPDLFILENIDELAGKPGTQQELLFTVGALLDRGACVAVSSAKAPMQLQELVEPSLFSRFHSGLSMEMPRPDRAFKEALWRHLLTQHALSETMVDLSTAERIFSIQATTARKAHSLFINCISRLSFKRGLDMSDVSELAMKHATPIAMLPQHSPSDVMERVAKICGLGVAAIQGRVRRPDVALARRFVCLALSRFLGLTNSVIASLVEKDPSTISHALKLAEKEIESNRRVAQQWNYICTQLGMQPVIKNL